MQNNMNMQNQQGSMMPNMNMQNQGMVMQQPPGVISTKDCMYLTDMMSWNLLAAKKANFFAQQVQDQEVKTAAQNCAQMHQQHYQKLLHHLGEHAQQQQPLQNMQ